MFLEIVLQQKVDLKKEMIHRIISKGKWFLTIIHRSGYQANKTRQRQGQAENEVITRAELRQAGREQAGSTVRSVKALSFWANASRNYEPQWVDIIITAQTTKQCNKEIHATSVSVLSNQPIKGRKCNKIHRNNKLKKFSLNFNAYFFLEMSSECFFMFSTAPSHKHVLSRKRQNATLTR